MSRDSSSFPQQSTRRSGRAFALLLSLLLIALLTAVTAEVVTLTAAESVIQGRRDRTLAHELAVDSVLLRLADALNESRRSSLIDDLDQGREARLSFTLGDVAVACRIRDDGARFNPNAFERDDQQNLLTRKLTLLSTRLPLPAVTIRLQPITDQPGQRSERRYRWFDQLLGDAQPGTVLRWTVASVDSGSYWSDVVTFWGDGRIDVRRAAEPVLEAALEDIRPGLARIILAARKNDADFRPTALVGVDAEIRAEVAGRLAFDVRRYALSVVTTIGADRRHWFSVATIDRGEVQVHHRSQLTW